ncbi:MAG: rane protein [Bacilli bacterium]|nr:rane protein [Bacilli bacterium]
MLFLITRLLGKKQISQLTLFEYVVGITLGELAGFMSTDIEANYVHGIVALVTWFLFAYILEIVTLKSLILRHWFEGRGTVMVKDGKVLEDNLKKEKYTGDELMESLRTKNVFNLADVEFAILEASGDLNVLLKKENQPLTPKHLGIKIAPEQEPQMVINDGEIMDEPLATMGLNRKWLKTELEKTGIPLENIFLGQVDSYGELFLDLYDDQLKLPQSQNKAILLATLKKCEADLELFGLATKNKAARKMYAHCVTEMKKLLYELTPILKR